MTKHCSLNGRHSWGSLVNRFAFSSAVSRGFMQWSHALYLYSLFHANWQLIRGSSENISAPSGIKQRATRDLPYKNNLVIFIIKKSKKKPFPKNHAAFQNEDFQPFQFEILGLKPRVFHQLVQKSIYVYVFKVVPPIF